jgi:hypothetical protein
MRSCDIKVGATHKNRGVSTPVWCVRHQDGWCACESEPKEGENNVPTLCDHFIWLPGGFEKREPTCPECLKVLQCQ